MIHIHLHTMYVTYPHAPIITHSTRLAHHTPHTATTSYYTQPIEFHRWMGFGMYRYIKYMYDDNDRQQHKYIYTYIAYYATFMLHLYKIDIHIYIDYNL